jgi:glycosyltransferase involved in cell wall biosynthesis
MNNGEDKRGSSLSDPLQPQVSVVIPCLNEERTIGQVIDEVHEAFQKTDFSYEILVADNGSTDRSRSIALSHRAQVMAVSAPGYGAALVHGIRASKGRIILFGDADLTYDFREGPRLLNRLLQGDVDLVIGTRLKGTIEKGAMPAVHRYLGTPMLTWLIRLLFGVPLTDSNSGLRAFYRDRFIEWKIQSAGMEICSEIIINCLRRGGHLAEVPITLRKDLEGRISHLVTSRDGMKNLLFILSRAPHGFTSLGLSLLLFSLLVAAAYASFGPVKIGFVWLLGVHTMILNILAGFLGAQIFSYGLLLDSQSSKPLKINAFFLQLREVVLFRLLLGLFGFLTLFVVFLTVVWFHHGFHNIDYLRPSLCFLYGGVVGGSLGLGIFMAQIQQRV